jgi:predicted helicase
MTVVFSTYQSIQVVADAQTKHKLTEFDLIICDEAHRTTGAKFEGEEESNFIKVHDQSFIKGKKRIYMTATPRIYGEAVQSRAAEASVELCSMDNPDLYGEVLFERGFSWAVENGLLTDYKVIVLAVDEEMVSASVQKRLADGTQELKLDDATKIIGCYKALTKSDLKADVSYDPLPMRRALAFCRDIKSSKLIAKEFEAVVEEYLTNVFHNEELRSEMPSLTCELDHVDGTFNAKSRNKLLDWLRNNNEPETCRILSNAR